MRTLQTSMSTYDYLTAVSRNVGFISPAEQSMLRESHIAIAGAGGDGGMLAVQLARLGIGGITLADPEDFEVENLNRQAEATIKSIGRNKAEVVAERVRDIAPEMNVRVFPEGVTPENVRSFFAGADLLIDETEITTPDVAVLLARQARQNAIASMTVLNVGFACMATSFAPDGITLEEVLGFDDGDEQVDMSRWLPYIPPYTASQTLREFAGGERPAPSVAMGVALAASVGATQALLHLAHGSESTRRPKPVLAPKALVVDVMTARVTRLRMSPWTHRRHIATIMLRARFSRSRHGAQP
jgi:molybdopterin/thiamine biosynthesis adenylyltransferase